MKLAILLWGITGAFCYMPTGKESFLSGLLLRDLVNRMNNKDFSDLSYMDFNDGLPLDPRSLSRDLEEEQMFPIDYENLGDINIHPSIRDQEYLKHSTLWANRYAAENSDESNNQLLRPEAPAQKQQEVKSDSTLPAYCNPPNPCPVDYTAAQGCLEDFENTASYSRRYQASQNCMCDSEHMFDCPNPSGFLADDPMDSIDQMEFNRFIQHTMKTNPAFQHKNLVAKKYHLYEKSAKINPFLAGEKLPVAAKKGTNVLF